MKPFTTHAGLVAAMDRANVDTDQIIPKQFLKRIERTGFGEFLFWDWARRRPPRGPRLTFSYEPEILGTGGALRQAAWFFDAQPFWLVNADTACDLDPEPLRETFARRRPLAAVWLHPDRGPRTVEMRRGRLTGFRSSRPGTAGTYTFCGLHLLAPRILEYLPPAGFASIIAAYERAGAAGECVAGVCLPGAYWADIGTPGAYIAAHAETAVFQRRLEFRRRRGVDLPYAVRRLDAAPISRGRGVRRPPVGAGGLEPGQSQRCLAFGGRLRVARAAEYTLAATPCRQRFCACRCLVDGRR